MDLITGPEYEEHFTAYVDLLGFSGAMNGMDETARLNILRLLQSLSALRGEFDAKSIPPTPQQSGTTTYIKPAVSTFSDHIVISYPLRQMSADTGFADERTALSIRIGFIRLLTRIASTALSKGFLIRGGATIGKLYHSGGVVFGEALVCAHRIESRISFYPRVVLSPQITTQQLWMKDLPFNVLKGDDGLYHFDYFTMLTLQSAEPGEHWSENVKAWYRNAADIIGKNRVELENKRRLNELSKWVWFAHQFRSGLERMPEMVRDLGLSLDAISWPR